MCDQHGEAKGTRPGNITADGQNALTYDGENRMVSSTQVGATSSYAYDGNSLRVKKISGGTTTVYVFSGTEVIAEYAAGAAVSSPAREYLYSGSQLLTTIEGISTKYHHRDQLSVRVNTDATGTVIGQQGHYPFGEDWYNTSTTTKWKFTSYERDAESGNDYAIARHYSSRLGRFLSPDLLGGVVGDPQSLNRYAYSRNDPINRIDPLGLTCIFVDEESGDITEDPEATKEECEEEEGIFINVENTVEVHEEVDPIDPFDFTFNDPLIFDPVGFDPVGPGSPDGGQPSVIDRLKTINDCLKREGSKFSLAGIINKLTDYDVGDIPYAGFLADALLENGVWDVTGIVGIGPTSGSPLVGTGKALKKGSGSPLKIGGNSSGAIRTLMPRPGAPSNVLVRNALPKLARGAAKFASKALLAKDLIDIGLALIALGHCL